MTATAEQILAALQPHCGGAYVDVMTDASDHVVVLDGSFSPAEIIAAADALRPLVAANPQDDDSLQRLHDLLFAAQRSTGDSQAKAIGDARLLLWNLRAAGAQATAAAPVVDPLPDLSTPGEWFVRYNSDKTDCFVAAPDCKGFAYDAEILGDDEYTTTNAEYDRGEPDAGVKRKTADCELIVAAVKAYRASPGQAPSRLWNPLEAGNPETALQLAAVIAHRDQQVPAATFQQHVQPWLLECFGAEIAADRRERNHRFFEEATELVQATGMTRSEGHQLVDYVYDRPTGEPRQEVGGVMVTLAALCLANNLDMHDAGEAELTRIWTKVEAIRAKQAAKPRHSPLPAAPKTDTGVMPRIVLADGGELCYGQYVLGSPKSLWCLHRGGAHIRWLNEFEQEFVNAALRTARHTDAEAARPRNKAQL